MSQESPLSTRLDIPCRHCHASYRLVDATDALAARPVTVEVVCSECGHKTALTLVDGGRARHPSSGHAASPHTLSPDAPRARAPGSVSGVNLTSRYSIRAPETEAPDEGERITDPGRPIETDPKGRSSVA